MPPNRPAMAAMIVGMMVEAPKSASTAPPSSGEALAPQTSASAIRQAIATSARSLRRDGSYMSHLFIAQPAHLELPAGYFVDRDDERAKRADHQLDARVIAIPPAGEHLGAVSQANHFVLRHGTSSRVDRIV